jgi:hypothetical protein
MIATKSAEEIYDNCKDLFIQKPGYSHCACKIRQAPRIVVLNIYEFIPDMSKQASKKNALSLYDMPIISSYAVRLDKISHQKHEQL